MDTSKLSSLLLDQSGLELEIKRLKEELGSKIALHFQDKISSILEESATVKKNMERYLNGMTN